MLFEINRRRISRPERGRSPASGYSWEDFSRVSHLRAGRPRGLRRGSMAGVPQGDAGVPERDGRGWGKGGFAPRHSHDDSL